MGNDGVAAIHHAGVVAALIEHAQIAAQHTGEVHVAVHGALIRADHGKLALIKGEVRVLLQQALQHLIGGHCVIKAHQRHSVLHAGVMSIKSDDVAHTHGLQLLQGHSAVQTFAHHTAMLTAAVQAGHNNRHTVCLAGHCLDQALQVGEVIVRRHVVLVVEQLVGHTVVAGIDHDEDIVAAHRLLHQTLGIATLEAGAVARNNEGLFVNSGSLGPADQMLVDQAGQFLCTGAGDQPHICHAGLLKERLRGNFNRHSHNSLLLFTIRIMHTRAHIWFYFITFRRFCHINLFHVRIFCALHSCFSFFSKRMCVFDKKTADSLPFRKFRPIFVEK